MGVSGLEPPTSMLRTQIPWNSADLGGRNPQVRALSTRGRTGADDGVPALDAMAGLFVPA